MFETMYDTSENSDFKFRSGDDSIVEPEWNFQKN